MSRKKKAQRRPRRPNLSREALEAIPLWVELGARPVHIAAALDMPLSSLYVVCSRHQISLRPSGPTLLTVLTIEQLGALQREAVRRGAPVWRLAGQVLGAVVDGGLFNVVLGGGEGVGRKV